MASANHLLMVFIGVEMASLPSYALAGFLKGRRQSSEAALKYVVYGGGAAGVMLYGISLLAGKFGTGYLPDLAAGYVAIVAAAAARLDPVLLLGTLFILDRHRLQAGGGAVPLLVPGRVRGGGRRGGRRSCRSRPRGRPWRCWRGFVLALAGLTRPRRPTTPALDDGRRLPGAGARRSSPP